MTVKEVFYKGVIYVHNSVLLHEQLTPVHHTKKYSFIYNIFNMPAT